MIKVLHLVGVMNRAGLETFIMNMYRNIDKENYEFDFLCTLGIKGEYDEEIQNYGGKIFYMPLKTTGGVKRHVYNYRLMKKELRRYSTKYDVFHIHNYHAFDSLIAAFPAVQAGFNKVIVHSHSTSAEFHVGLHKLARPILNKLKITKLACSKAAGMWLFGKDDIQVISNGVDVQKYQFNQRSRDKYRKMLSIEADYVIGHVGRFEYVKNQKFLCKMLSVLINKIPRLKIVFVGDGCEKNKIEALCKEKDLIDHVLFLGSRDDVDKLYQAFDVFVLPSYFEGIPLSIIEAESSGLPCVLSNGVPKDVDIVPNVYHEDIDNMEAWEKIIVFLQENTFDRTTNADMLIKAGYDIRNSCKKLQEIYEL